MSRFGTIDPNYKPKVSYKKRRGWLVVPPPIHQGLTPAQCQLIDAAHTWCAWINYRDKLRRKYGDKISADHLDSKEYWHIQKLWERFTVARYKALSLQNFYKQMPKSLKGL